MAKKVRWEHDIGISKQKLLELKRKFGLDSRAVRMASVRSIRPSAEMYGETFLIKAFSASLEKNKLVWIKHIIFFGKKFIATLGDKKCKKISELEKAYRKNSKEFQCSAEKMAYMFLNAAAETYSPVVDEIGETLDRIEGQLLKNIARKITLQKILELKKQSLEIRKMLHPQIETLNYLSRQSLSPKDQETTIYLRELHAYVLHLDDVVSGHREIITGMMDAYTSVVSNKLNEVMKLLTIIATIAMPLTVISSIYGMNIALPVQRDPMAFVYIIGLMLLIAVVMLAVFKSRDILGKN